MTKIAAVTGASSGIGEATAIALAEAGFAVALGARRLDRLEEIAERIRSSGGTAEAIEVDVADSASASAFVSETRERLGGLDVLVANAGVMLLGPIPGADTDEWRRMIDVNVYGVLYTTHAALPAWQEQDSGHVVIVSSVAGRVAGAFAGVYNLTKFGVGAFAEALRQETTDSGIRVTLVEPGAVRSELLSHNSDYVQQAAEKRLADVEILEAEDIADAIVWAVTRPERMAVNEVLVRPSRQR
jgi:NADP-dependent 3-hydroxy acid dehydrogenase YdfG